MPSNRQGQIILIFIIASLLLHAVVFALASQFRIEPRKFEEPEKPRTITLRRIEPPPEPEPQQAPPQDMFVPTLDSQETAEADPNTNLISERNTQARTQEAPSDPNSVMPEMSGAERNALNYQTIQGLPGQQPGVPGQQPTPPTEQKPPTEQEAEAKEKQQQEVEKPQKAEEMPKEKPVESEVVEKFEKVEEPQDAKAEEVVELAKANPNDVPLRPERVYPTDAMPLLKPEPRREKARPLQKIENPEKMAEKTQPVTPPTPAGGFSASRVRSDVRGGGRRGDYSASSRASAEGRYMAKLHRAIGSYWYQYIGRNRSLLQVGEVTITLFLRSNGTVEHLRVSSDTSGGSNVVLINQSMRAIRNAAPFDVFPEEMKRKYGEGFEYSFTFSVY